QLSVGNFVELEDANADAVVRESEANAAFRQLVQLEEALESLAERLGVANLARHDDAGLEGLAEDLDELGRAVVDNLRRCDLRGADLQADELLRPFVCGRLAWLRAGVATTAEAARRRYQCRSRIVQIRLRHPDGK